MIPIRSAAQMAAIDAAAEASMETLIGRAGWSVARSAIDMMGGTYGRRVLVLAGRGNNGADGRVAASILARRGVLVQVIDQHGGSADDQSVGPLGRFDLVIDAAYGTGLTRPYFAPEVGNISVLAVDIPSGLHADTGQSLGRPLRADRTVTFCALKPGMLLADGPSLCGEIEVADIGLDAGPTGVPVGGEPSGGEPIGGEAELVEPTDVERLVPPRGIDANKWHAAAWIVGASPGMEGALCLSADGALSSGAALVRASGFIEAVPNRLPIEAIWVSLDPQAQEPSDGSKQPDGDGWASQLLAEAHRFGAIGVGPGMGRRHVDRDAEQIARLASELEIPLVLDADALWAAAEGRLRFDGGNVVLTPHDGEFARLLASADLDDARVDAVAGDRVAQTQLLAGHLGAVILRKGPTTLVVHPNGGVRYVNSGDQRLATAGSGDVLTGLLTSLLCQGLVPFDAAAIAAFVHGAAAGYLVTVGAVASDLPWAISRVMSSLVKAGSQ